MTDVVDEWIKNRRERVRESAAKKPEFKLGVFFPDNLGVQQRLFRVNYDRARDELHLPYQEHWVDCAIISDMRNASIDRAFSNDLTHIIMIDMDMVLKPYSLVRLVSWAAQGYPLVSAIAFKRMPPHSWCCYDREAEGLYRPVSIDKIRSGKGGLIEVDGVGMATCIISMEMAAKMGPRPFDPIMNPERNEPYGEDLSFCIRAQQAGYRIYADTSHVVGHIIDGYIGDSGYVWIQGRPWADLESFKRAQQEETSGDKVSAGKDTPAEQGV